MRVGPPSSPPCLRRTSGRRVSISYKGVGCSWQMGLATEQVDDRYAAVRQYSLAEILGVWAAAAIPMGVLAWIVAPLLRDQLGGPEPLAQALLICLTAGLIWQFVLVLILLKRELGGLQWSRVREALWLRPPRDPKSGKVGGRVWWWV